VFGQHHTDCPFHNANNTKRLTSVGVSFTGLRSVISRVITASLTCSLGGPTLSLAPALQVCRSVESRFSPAFRLFDPRDDLGCKLNGFKISGTGVVTFTHASGPDLYEAFHELQHRLHLIYSSRSASPLDVNQHGDNIAHRVIEVSITSP
jgi:hypothetical protein